MRNQKAYSFLARVYDVLFAKGLEYERAANIYVTELPLSKNDNIKVLDAGCGTGLFTIAILNVFPNAEVTAFDLNEKMLNRLQLKLKTKWQDRIVKTFSADIRGPLFIVNDKFDLVITAGVLEYVNISMTIKNLSFHLKEGGYFLVAGVRNNMLGRFIGWVWGFKPYSIGQTLKTFKAAGFDLVEFIKPSRGFFLLRLAKQAFIFKKIKLYR
jgi:ubiquinone/menaquinone biosynthesis C-methylase UbiE